MSVSALTSTFLYCPTATGALTTTTYTRTFTEVCPTATVAVEYAIVETCGASWTAAAIPPNFVVITTLGQAVTTPAATATDPGASIITAKTMPVMATSSADAYVTVSAAGPSAGLSRALGLVVSGAAALTLLASYL